MVRERVGEGALVQGVHRVRERSREGQCALGREGKIKERDKRDWCLGAYTFANVCAYGAREGKRTRVVADGRHTDTSTREKSSRCMQKQRW